MGSERASSQSIGDEPSRLAGRRPALGLLAILLAAVPGCTSLAEDHALSNTVGASLQRFDRSIRRSIQGLDREVRGGLQDATESVVALPGAATRRTDRLRRSTESLVGTSLVRAENSPLRIRDTVLTGVRNERRHAASLTHAIAPSTIGAQLERSAGRLHGELVSLPSTLRLDRTLVPVLDDASSGPDPIPSERSPSLFERVLRQIPW